MADMLRTKAMLNFTLLLIPKRGKNALPIYPALKGLILIRNDKVTSESLAKKPFANTFFVE